MRFRISIPSALSEDAPEVAVASCHPRVGCTQMTRTDLELGLCQVRSYTITTLLEHIAKVRLHALRFGKFILGFPR
jgi:hypothetical protein